MSKVDRHTQRHRALLAWYHASHRELPWRYQPAPYPVWVSEIMLQQTQVVTVLGYFERWMKRFPSVEKLAAASEADVLSLWQGLGYYSRARSLWKGARHIVERGEFPRTREQWLEVPGVGPYTAGAICSIALGLSEPLVDGNVERVFARWFRLKRAPSEKAFQNALWNTASRELGVAVEAGAKPGDWNQALMELGATVCKPQSPLCGSCPVSTHCHAYQETEVTLYPEKKTRPSVIEVKEHRVALIDSKEQVLLVQARAGKWRAGLWDLPSPEELEALGISGRAKDLEPVTTRHVVTRHRITRVTEIRSKTRALKRSSTIDQVQAQWVALDPKQNGLPLSAASRRTLIAVQSQWLKRS